MKQGRVNVIIADDYPFVRRGIRRLLEGSPDIYVCGEAENGQEAVDLVEKFHPDVLILDLQMPVMDGFQAMEYLRAHGNQTRVLVVSAFGDPQYRYEIFSRGAWGYYLKEEVPGIIVEVVKRAARGVTLPTAAAIYQV